MTFCLHGHEKSATSAGNEMDFLHFQHSNTCNFLHQLNKNKKILHSIQLLLNEYSYV